MGFWGTLARGGLDLATGGGYEGYKYLNDKAAQGYNTAAQGAQQAYGQGQQFSQDQWNRQMEGLQGALGAYTPSQAYWQNTYGNNVPGAADNYWTQHGSQFGQPGAQQGSYDNYKAWALNPSNNMTQNGATNATGYVTGANAASDFYNQYGSGLTSYGGPQNGASQYNAYSPQYNKAGAGENYYAQNADRYGQETNSQSYFNSMAPSLYSQGLTEQLAQQGMIGSDIGSQSLGYHQGFAQGPTALDTNESENKGLLRGANQASDYYQSQLPALSGPGAYEQFVNSDISGNNPALAQARQESLASLNQELARRGHFNSGGADVALGKMEGSFQAQDYENRAQRAQQAQQMQLARIGQGAQTAQGAAGLDIQRGQGLAGMDTQNESARTARQGVGLQAEQTAVQEAEQNSQLQLNAAQAADQNRLARLSLGSNMANGADSNNLNYLNAGAGAANDAQSQMLARLSGGMGAANSVDQTSLASAQQALSRLMGAYGMAQGSDAQRMAQGNALFGYGQGVDQSNMNRYNMLGQQAQNMDQYNLASLLGGMNSAQGVQNLDQQRQQEGMAALFGMNNAQAGQYGQFYGQGGQLSGSSMSDALNALMAMYGYQGQGQMAQAQLPFQIGGMAINGYKASQGGG